MDVVGTNIAQRIPTGEHKVQVRMVETGEIVKLLPIDAREAIESRRAKLVGPPLHSKAQVVRRPVLTEDDIIEAHDRNDDETLDVMHRDKEQPAEIRESARGGPPSRAPRSPLPKPDLHSN